MPRHIQTVAIDLLDIVVCIVQENDNYVSMGIRKYLKQTTKPRNSFFNFCGRYCIYSWLLNSHFAKVVLVNTLVPYDFFFCSTENVSPYAIAYYFLKRFKQNLT